MLQLRFQGVVGYQTRHALYAGDKYEVQLKTVSPYCTVMSFLKDAQPIDVPPKFSMVIPTPSGTKIVDVYEGRYFAMSHSVWHMLVFDQRTVVCVSPESFGHQSGAPIIQSTPSSLNSSEEVSRSETRTHGEENKLREYICDTWGDCNELRQEVETLGKEKFYYDKHDVPVTWKTYQEFVTDHECWCGQC